MIKRCLGILLLVALLAQFLPGSLFQPSGAEAQDPAPASKISSLLTLQVQAKLRASKAGGVSAALASSQQAGLFDILQSQDISLEDLSKQQVFIHFTEKPSQSQIAELEAVGITLHLDSWIPPLANHPSGFILADMPIDKLETLAEKGYIVRLETAERVLQPQNDLGTQKINANAVWASGYNGTGVSIAVLDSGLDLTHADIPTPVAKKDYSNYPTSLDDTIANTVTGHGTHVTGSVLGRGTQSGGVYKGSAPGADLIFLKIGNDTTGSASTAAIVGAISAATDNYSADIITISYGGWDTYHDGSSEESQAVEYAVSQGVVVLIAAGNDAASKKHYSGTVAASSTTDFISANVTGAGTGNTPLWFNLVWYDGTASSNNLTMQLYDPSQTPLATFNSPQSQSTRGTEARQGYYGTSTTIYAVPSGNSLPFVKVTNSSTSSQFFHLYVWTSGAGSVTFQNADPNYTIASPADADSAIAVGAYNTRQTWWNYANAGYWFPNDPVDQISTFSNRGPRVDTGAPGKPNVVAPGSGIISARDSVVYPWPSGASSRFIDNDGPNTNNSTKNNGSGPADYYLMTGTSMATPLAAGVAALILQKNPGWTPAQVKQAIESTATDNGTPGWDSIYGWGLVNALAAVSVEPPAVTTNAADNITASSARLSGNLTSLGTAATANVSFQWGLTDNYTGTTPAVSMNATGAFSYVLTGLSANTTYHFRAKAVGDGAGYGAERSFTTYPIPLPAPGGIVSDSFERAEIAPWTKKLNGGGEVSIVNGQLQITTTNEWYNNEARLDFSPLVSDFLLSVDVLVQADSSSATNLLVTIGGDPADLDSDFVALQQDGYYPHWNVYAQGSWAGYVTVLGTYQRGVKGTVTIKKKGTAYEFRFNDALLWAGTGANLSKISYVNLQNGVGVPGSTRVAWDNLIIQAPPPPAVITDNADNITVTSARLSGNLTSLGTALSANVSFQWGLTDNYTYETTPVSMNATGLFSYGLTGLSANTTYHFRAKAVGDATSYGVEKTFTTRLWLPGDANGDGEINALDITAVERISAGLDTPTPGADANQDGKINAVDITKVERKIAGLD